MKNEADRINATLTDEARDGLRTRIDLDAFLALSSDDRAIRWRQWPISAKEDAIRQQLMRSGYRSDAADVAQWIAHYDEKYSAGPVELAVEGALERLAIEHSNAARLADRLGDKAHRRVERAAATAFTRALEHYKAGVRPELLDSGAWLVPSSTPGKAAHLIHMDGDWVCCCAAGANMHWPIALVLGIEGSQEDMTRDDDGGDAEADRAAAALAERLEATAAIIDAMRSAQGRVVCDPPHEPSPLGDEEGDSVPSARQLGWRLASARKRSAYFASSFYLEAA